MIKLTKLKLTESFRSLKYTPLYKIEQNEREKLQWSLLFVQQTDRERVIPKDGE